MNFASLIDKAKVAAKHPLWIQWVAVLALFLLFPYWAKYYNREFTQNAGRGPSDQIELTKLIRSVKSELYNAEKEMHEKGELALFEMKTVDLELNFIARETIKEGVQLFAVTGGSETGLERTQKITVHMGVIRRPDETRKTAPTKEIKSDGIKKVD